MFDLTKQEKIILLFLTLTFVTGLAVSAYKKTDRNLVLNVQPYKINAEQDEADRLIQQYRYVNINSFKIDELTRLPGVGKVIAQQIIEYHKLYGPFKTKEQLLQVEGIGEKKFERIKGLIILE